MKQFFTLFLFMLLSGFAWTQEPQDTIDIPSGPDNRGLLETTINNDIDTDTLRINPNRVYRLMPGIHFQNSAINVDNPDGTIIIIGAKGGKKPVVVPVTTADIGPGNSIINGSLTIDNVHFQNMNDQGGRTQNVFELQGLNRKLKVTNSLFEFAEFSIFHANAVTDGLVIEMRNNYFRDMFWDNQWWAYRVVEAKVPIDSLIFENNTVVGSGMAILQQEAMCKYALFNHNSFINNVAHTILNNYYLEAYFTNNLFYNNQLKGEDTNLIDLEPDNIPTSIVGLDTIEASILVSDWARIDENTLTEEVSDINNYKIYTADNIYFNQPELDAYYGGGFNDIGDYPVSYITWSGADGPHKVNVPTPWMNERALAFYANYENIVEENNILETDPELATEAMSEDDVTQFAIWNRLQYAVAEETRTPDMSGFNFGDSDPLTIPGEKTENGDGIVNFYDLTENFLIGSTFVSRTDGHTIGALHWNDEIDNFDPAVSRAAIESRYADAVLGISSVENAKLNEAQPELAQNTPNPFDAMTSVEFNLVKTSNVKLTLTDLNGKLIHTFVNQKLNAGKHVYSLENSNLTSGIYLYTLEAGSFVQTKKMVVK